LSNTYTKPPTPPTPRNVPCDVKSAYANPEQLIPLEVAPCVVMGGSENSPLATFGAGRKNVAGSNKRFISYQQRVIQLKTDLEQAGYFRSRPRLHIRHTQPSGTARDFRACPSPTHKAYTARRHRQGFSRVPTPTH